MASVLIQGMASIFMGQKLSVDEGVSYGEVLIQFIPGDAYAMSHETPLSALLGGGREETREPHEGCAEFATIGEDTNCALLSTS
jgi:hypothetical protein